MALARTQAAAALAGRTAVPAGRGVVGDRQGGHVAEMQRRRLLVAFADVLGEHGFEGASVGRVCARAGVSRRTFYELFDDREACFVGAFAETIEQLAGRVVPVFTSAGRWRERVRAALTVLLDLFDEEPSLARLCLVETLKAGPPVLEQRRRVLAILAQAIEQGRGKARSSIEPAPLTAESTVGGALAVVHARVLQLQQQDDPQPRPLVELVNPLMSMIVNPYLGPAAARRELELAVPHPSHADRASSENGVGDPFKDLPIRITFRTARVLAAIGERSDASNRQVADAAGVPDQGQMSKLLRRLEGHGLIENVGTGGYARGEPNAWRLTPRGHAISNTLQAPMVHSASPATR